MITTYTYNERDWLVARSDPDGFSIRPNGPTIEYEYDAAGNRTAVRTPSERVTYTFNERNWLASATGSDGRTTTYRYDAIGNLVRTEFGSGVVETRQYNDLNQLLVLKNAKINPTSGQESILTSYTYTLDKVGNRLSMLDQTGRLVEYDYDALYRLKQEKVTQAGAVHTTSYQYDPVGNRLQMNDSAAGVTTYIYDANDRLLSETKGGVMTTYSYDNNGNTLSKSNGTEQTTYVWNDENRLVGVQTPEVSIVYTYDTDGIRMSSEVNGVKTNYLVDKNRDYAQVLEEYEDGELSVTYVYGRDLISQERGSQTSFYLVDGLGSTTALTDANGSLTDTYTYAAFGELIDEAGENTENSYLFAGEQFDEALNEYYLRQRYYNFDVGRFTRRDSYEGKFDNPLSLHKYIYTGGNPINFIDPSGLFTQNELTAVTTILKVLPVVLLVASVGGDSPVVSGRLTPSQRAALQRARMGHLEPLLKEDSSHRGCFTSEIPRKGASNAVLRGQIQPPEWFKYATQVTGTDNDYLVVTPNNLVSSFDGRTEGTRNVWEAKYGYEDLLNSNSFMYSILLSDIEAERAKQIPVAAECHFNLRWAFSNEGPARFVRNRWSNVPPILHIPYV